MIINIKMKTFLKLGFLVAIFGLGIFFSPFAGVTNTQNQNSQTQSQNLKSSAGVSSNPTGDSWPMFRGGTNHTASTNTTLKGGSGGPIWNYTTNGSVESSPAITNGCVYIGSDDYNVYCLNASNSHLVWNYTTGGCVQSSPAVAGGDVYVGSMDGYIYCLDASNGNLVWSNNTGGCVYSSPAVVNGYVYVGSENDQIHCLNASSGDFVWNYTTGGNVDSSPAVVSGYVYVGSDDNQTYCLNALTGSKVWSNTTDGMVESSPAVANGYIYVGSDDHQVYCLDASNGDIIWNYTTGGIVKSSPAVFGGMVYIGSEDGNVYCINAANGLLIWRNTNATGILIDSSPAISNGMVFIGNLGGSLYALNANTGTVINKNSGYNAISSSPAIQGGYIYVGDWNNETLCLPLVNSPSAPLNFAANGGHGNVTLTWTQPVTDGGAPINNYVIYRGTSSTSLSFLTNAGNVLTYMDTYNLINGTTYYYSISAENTVGIVGTSSSIKQAMPIGPPDAPQSVVATAGCHNITLSWIAPSNTGGLSINNFEILRGTSSGSEVLDKFMGNGTATSYTDTGLTNGTTYYYIIRAYNSIGGGPNSTEVSALCYGLSMAPQNLTATCGDGNIVLNWIAPSYNGNNTITNYNIYRGTSSGAETLIATVGDVLTYTDTNVINGTTYYYKVSAVNAGGASTNSSEKSATPVGPPSVPQNFSAKSENAQVLLSWNAPASNGGENITYYNIYRSSSSGSEVYLTNVSGSSYNYTDTGLTNGQTYYYMICAVNSKGNGTNSSEIFATPNIEKPSAPQNLAIVAGDGKVVLTWTAPLSNGGSAIKGYIIYRDISSRNESLTISIGNVVTYTDSNVTNGQTYYYKICAVNSIGNGVNSTEIHAEPVGAPLAPQNLIAQVGAGQVVITWAAPLSNQGSTITGYNVYRGTSSGAETLIATVGNVLTYTDTSVKNGQTYYYTVSAINSIGTSPRSPEASVTTQGSSSSSKNASINGMGIGVLLTISMLGVVFVIFRVKKHLK